MVSTNRCGRIARAVFDQGCENNMKGSAASHLIRNGASTGSAKPKIGGQSTSSWFYFHVDLKMTEAGYTGVTRLCKLKSPALVARLST